MSAPPRLAGCQILPADNPFNQPVNQLPVVADSQQILARIGLDAPVHPDFGTVYDGAPNGIPINVVSSRTRRVPVRFQYAAYPHDHQRWWTAGSGAIFDLRSNHLRPAGWTSADAAGLPILPGLARYGDVAAGAIDHALRFTAPCTGPHYVYPARQQRLRGRGHELVAPSGAMNLMR